MFSTISSGSIQHNTRPARAMQRKVKAGALEKPRPNLEPVGSPWKKPPTMDRSAEGIKNPLLVCGTKRTNRAAIIPPLAYSVATGHAAGQQFRLRWDWARRATRSRRWGPRMRATHRAVRDPAEAPAAGAAPGRHHHHGRRQLSEGGLLAGSQPALRAARRGVRLGLRGLRRHPRRVQHRRQVGNDDTGSTTSSCGCEPRIEQRGLGFGQGWAGWATGEIVL